MSSAGRCYTPGKRLEYQVKCSIFFESAGKCKTLGIPNFLKALGGVNAWKYQVKC
jgi:hypothetical protein